jgi:hypothetical protein
VPELVGALSVASQVVDLRRFFGAKRLAGLGWRREGMKPSVLGARESDTMPVFLHEGKHSDLPDGFVGGGVGWTGSAFRHVEGHLFFLG